MNLLLSSNAREYAANLFRYADETGKTLAQVLAREGPDFRAELFNPKTPKPQNPKTPITNEY